MTLHHPIHRPLERRRRRHRMADRRLDVVERVPGRQMVEEPQPRLSERQRKRARALGLRDHRRDASDQTLLAQHPVDHRPTTAVQTQ